MPHSSYRPPSVLHLIPSRDFLVCCSACFLLSAPVCVEKGHTLPTEYANPAAFHLRHRHGAYSRPPHVVDEKIKRNPRSDCSAAGGGTPSLYFSSLSLPDNSGTTSTEECPMTTSCNRHVLPNHHVHPFRSPVRSQATDPLSFPHD